MDTDKSFKTLISLVIDRSASMSSMGGEPYKSIISFVKEQTTDNTYVTALKFDYICDRFIKPIISTKFTFQEYEISPRGTTALYEAIGTSLDYVDNIKSDYDKIIFVIMTDGEDNSSSGKYQGEKGRRLIKEMIGKFENVNNWAFYFLGANINAQDVGNSLGINTEKCMDFSADRDGCMAAINSCSQAVSRLRLDKNETGNFNSEERKTSMMDSN